jgi:Holliday junction resolvasome RuvABC DNA-binding subunit
MIGRLSGVLLSVEENLALIEVGGVGYEVRLPPNLREQLPPLGEPSRCTSARCSTRTRASCCTAFWSLPSANCSTC